MHDQLSPILRLLEQKYSRHWAGMRLYKFVSRKYLDAFFNVGSLRVGTLRGFADTTQFSGPRGDAIEGLATFERDLETFPIRDGHDAPGLVRDAERWVASGRGTKVRYEYLSDDAYIFCTSRIFTEAIFQKWHLEEGVDACYEITEPGEFQDAISVVLADTVFRFSSWCRYVDGDAPFADFGSLAPALFKFRDAYEWQQEQRMLWTPPEYTMGTLAPRLILAPEARRYCRPVAFIEGGRVRYASYAESLRNCWADPRTPAQSLRTGLSREHSNIATGDRTTLDRREKL